MTIDLSEIEFTNDFYSTELPDGSTLIINKVDEAFNFVEDSDTSNLAVNVLNLCIAITDDDDNTTYTRCTNIVGMSDDYISIETNYTDYEGQQLNTDNMIYCTIEIEED